MIKLTVETITPEMAKDYLKHNTDNYRKLSRTTVYKYAAEMKAGRWELNGEGIQFDESGKLKNGQHRLAAILVANVPVKMAVIRGVSDSVSVFDSGSNRTVVQIANARDLDVSTTEAAAAKIIASRFTHATTKGEVLAWLDKHAHELHRAYRIVSTNCSKNGGVSKRGPVLAAIYLMLQHDVKSYEAECFTRLLNTGDTSQASGYEPSPALIARDMLLKYCGTNGSMQNKEQCEITTLALDDFVSGKERKYAYKIVEPLTCVQMMEEQRKEDALNE